MRTEINLREHQLLSSISLKKTKGDLVRAYRERFGLARVSFYRRLKQVPFGENEKAFFTEYFTYHVPGGEKILAQVGKPAEP